MPTTELSKDEEAAFAAMQAGEPIPAVPDGETGETAPGGAEDEAASPADGGGSSERPPSRMVPHAALHEERTRRQGLEAENRRLVEERALFEGRLQAVLGLQRQAASPTQPPPEPDENTDPIGTIGHLRRRLAAVEAGGARLGEQARDQAVLNQLTAAATADAREFRARTPDYDEAYQFFLSNRDAELAFYGVPPAERAQIIDREQLQIAASAFQRGASPAQLLYDVARHRGFKGGGGGNGAAAGERIERIASGQARGRTLSGTGGGAAGPEMTAERLLKMSNAEFDAWTSRNPAKAKRLMGG
jgi:hypothetical protein